MRWVAADQTTKYFNEKMYELLNQDSSQNVGVPTTKDFFLDIFQ